MTQPPRQRLSHERILIDIGEDVAHRLSCNVACNPKAFDLPQHACLAAPFDGQLGAGAGESGAIVIERVVPLQPRHRAIDVGGIEATPRQARPDLRLGQLAARQEFQTCHIGIVGH